MWEARILLVDGAMLEAALEAVSARGRRPGPAYPAYRLRYGRHGEWQVSYEDGVRRAGGRASRYEFRSVEQLRYDFERDVEEAQAEDRRRR